MPHEHIRPASFHSSPAEAMQAPPEEFLDLACLREGTGVHAPDFLAVVDAEGGRTTRRGEWAAEIGPSGRNEAVGRLRARLAGHLPRASVATYVTGSAVASKAIEKAPLPGLFP
jgi:hypothetical protein